MRATMTTNVVVAVVLFATAGAHAQECTRKLIAMLKAWKIKSQFSRLDDLIFPNCEGQHLGHDNFIKAAIPAAVRLAPDGQALQLARAQTLRGIMLDRSRARAEDGAGFRWPCVAASHDGSIRALIPERRSPEGDGTRLPRDYSRRARRTLG